MTQAIIQLLSGALGSTLALPLEETTGGRGTPGEAASLREAPPPGPPPEEWLGVGLCVPSEVSVAHGRRERAWGLGVAGHGGSGDGTPPPA